MIARNSSASRVARPSDEPSGLFRISLTSLRRKHGAGSFYKKRLLFVSHLHLWREGRA